MKRGTAALAAVAAAASAAAPPAAAAAGYDLEVTLRPEVRVLSNDRDARGRGILRGKVTLANTRRAQTRSAPAELELGGDPMELDLKGGACERDYPLRSNCFADVPGMAPGDAARLYRFAAFYEVRGVTSGRLDAEVDFPCRAEVSCANNSTSAQLSVLGSPDSRIRRASARSFSGRARRRRAGSRVTKVEIALLREGRRARAFKGLPAPWGTGRRRCRWLASRHTRFKRVRANGRTCDRPLWLRARGKGRWSFGLTRPLPAGRYVLYSRAANRAGAVEQSFRGRDRNRRKFRVR